MYELHAMLDVRNDFIRLLWFGILWIVGTLIYGNKDYIKEKFIKIKNKNEPVEKSI